MSAITFSGLGTGMDTAAIIDQLVSLERGGIRKLETRKSDYNSQIKIFQNINSNLSTLRTKAQDLSSISDVLSYSTTSSDADKVGISANGNAKPGSYAVTVSQLAQSQRTYSSTFESSTTAGVAGAGTLSIQVGSEDAVDIAIEADDTLEDIVSKINATDTDTTASLIETVDGWRLQVSGTETGADNAVSFTETGVTLGLTNTVQTAQDALITVDGFNVQSSTNQVDSAIPGVTLNLKEETDVDETITVNVTADSNTTRSKIQGLVDTYNSIVSMIRAENAYTGEAKGGNRLTGDSTLRSLQMQMGTMISSALEGLEGNFSSLAEIGISTDRTGQLSIDSTKFDEAMNQDAVGVAQILAGTADGSAEGIADKLETLVDNFIDYSDGIITARVSGLNERIKQIDVSIGREETRVLSFEDRLRAQFTAMETMVNTLNSQSSFLAQQTGAWA